MHLSKTGYLFLTALALAACGKDDDNTSAQSAGSEERAELTREQREQQAELERQQAEERAELARNEANDKVNVEKAEFTQARQEYEAKARERLEKIDAKAQELQSKVASLNVKARKQIAPEMTAYTTERDQIKAEISQLQSTPKENWDSSTESVDHQLEGLEQRLDRVKDKL